MRFLFVHQNFPGQYRHVARALAADPAHQVLAVGQADNMQRQGQLDPRVQQLGYRLQVTEVTTKDPYLRDTEAAIIRARAIAKIALDLRAKGFVPDVIAGHPGWGETLFLRDVFPDARIVSYCEFYYRGAGADVGFDPEFPETIDDVLRVRVRDFTHLSAIESADVGVAPSKWQRSLFPSVLQPRITVLHEGIDTGRVRPDPEARLAIDGGVLTGADPVVTYVARNLEPYRGFHVFMRTLPAIQERNPGVRVVVVGGDDVSYGRRRKDGITYREALRGELGDAVDWSRVHFLGRLPYDRYLSLLQISRVHVYLTYPFVLSWSMLEAMAAGCVVVASDTEPVREVARDDENALLVGFFDREAIAARVTEVLQNPGDYAAVRDAARRTIVQGYDLQTRCLPQGVALLTGAAPAVGT